MNASDGQALSVITRRVSEDRASIVTRRVSEDPRYDLAYAS